MKTLNKRLAPILQIAQKKSDEAARALGVLNQKLSDENRMLNQLQVYQGDYMNMMGDMCKPGQRLNIKHITRYQNFIDRLELAQRQQNDQIAIINAQKEQVKKYWLKTRARVKALETVIKKDAKKRQYQQEKTEQKNLDEFNQNKLHRKDHLDK